MPNEACAVAAPTKLATWDHVADLYRMVKMGRDHGAFSKADRASAYKQLPTDANQAKHAIAALKSPVNEAPHGYFR